MTAAVPRPAPMPVSQRNALRPMRPGDLEAVVAIEDELYSHPWTLGNFRDSLHAGYSCWVLEGEHGLIGYCVMMVGVGEAHLLNLSIASPWQRRGLGRHMVEHLLELARGWGARDMLLEVRPSNTAARALYANMGFRELARRRDYYPAEQGREDAIVMARECGAPRVAGKLAGE
jgi:ribosomal-protein-alanine N-acetyltransferase